jgi:hypothetical protein
MINAVNAEISGSLGGDYEDDLSSGMLRHIVSQKLTDVSECFRGTFRDETSTNFWETTRCNIPEDSHLQG